MRFLIQRVGRASVHVSGDLVAQIGRGILVFVGIASGDGRKEAEYLADKVVNLRIFPDESGKMNLSALDCGADLLVVPQFTLYGSCRKGRRPSFDAAAAPADAHDLYQYVVERIREKGLKTLTGVFQARMDVELVNEGPVTLLIES